MTKIVIKDLDMATPVTPEDAALVKGGPLEIRELTIKAIVKAPDLKS